MEETQITSIAYTALISLFLLWCMNKWFCKHSVNKNFPPSPPKLPILGNLHQLGSLPHRNLQTLARKHGPLMLLQFGSVPVLMVSSADAAREIMKTHDLTFANRPMYRVFEKLLYGCKDITFSPYGEYWRQLRSIFALQLLSHKRVQSFRSIREEETELFMEKIGEYSSDAVNLSKLFAELSCDMISRSAFGKKYRESENGKKVVQVLTEIMELFGGFSIGEFVPWLSWISRVNGMDKRVDRVAKEMDYILEGVIEEHIETKNQRRSEAGRNVETFVDILLGIQNENSNSVVSIDRASIKLMILDVFIGGNDTISTALEWATTELLRHPTAMEKLQREIREIVKNNQGITNDDLEKMHYLKAVVKETLRQHPPPPLLVPKIAGKDVKIKGYYVSAGTVAMINVWAIGRDPASWEDPEMFKPERFLVSPIDFKGLDSSRSGLEEEDVLALRLLLLLWSLCWHILCSNSTGNCLME